MQNSRSWLLLLLMLRRLMGKRGPRFRNLGGMGEVLDELMMEVIVPLYHPYLSRWFGSLLNGGGWQWGNKWMAVSYETVGNGIFGGREVGSTVVIAVEDSTSPSPIFIG
ncbi:hypothetical protein V6N13_046363 [Hibiscus sabdariffa]|uniref:Secreted protein n=1 Tax=Hibiscus sabdariffa TaxID=183260 RepID=A0ABR2DAT0_9ROSI